MKLLQVVSHKRNPPPQSMVHTGHRILESMNHSCVNGSWSAQETTNERQNCLEIFNVNSIFNIEKLKDLTSTMEERDIKILVVQKTRYRDEDL